MTTLYVTHVTDCAGDAGISSAAAPAGRADLADDMPALTVDVRRVLEELDVQDDATLPAAARTRGKFRRCFGLEPPANALATEGPAAGAAAGLIKRCRVHFQNESSLVVLYKMSATVYHCCGGVRKSKIARFCNSRVRLCISKCVLHMEP